MCACVIMAFLWIAWFFKGWFTFCCFHHILGHFILDIVLLGFNFLGFLTSSIWLVDRLVDGQGLKVCIVLVSFTIVTVSEKEMITWATMEAASFAAAGTIMVVPSFAILPKASTYFSATAIDTASLPWLRAMAIATFSIPLAEASARKRMASASPAARLICSAFSASEAKIVACFRPSATLMAACLAPDWHVLIVFLWLSLFYLTFGLQDLRPFGPFCGYLLMHWFHHLGRWMNVTYKPEKVTTPV